MYSPKIILKITSRNKDDNLFFLIYQTFQSTAIVSFLDVGFAYQGL